MLLKLPRGERKRRWFERFMTRGVLTISGAYARVNSFSRRLFLTLGSRFDGDEERANEEPGEVSRLWIRSYHAFGACRDRRYHVLLHLFSLHVHSPITRTWEIFCGSRPDHVRFIQHARTSHGIVKLDGAAIELFYRERCERLCLVIHVTRVEMSGESGF